MEFGGDLAGLPEGLYLASQGDRAGARRVFAILWRAARDPLSRCGIAHSMADVQNDPLLELLWDLRALSAARHLGGASPLWPSLHLNLADVYRRLGAPDRAAVHVAAGRAALAEQPPDGYFEMIGEALDRVEHSLRATRSEIPAASAASR